MLLGPASIMFPEFNLHKSRSGGFHKTRITVGPHEDHTILFRVRTHSFRLTNDGLIVYDYLLPNCVLLFGRECVSMVYVLLFLEGILTFISPCLLPLLPLYISYFAAGGEGRGRTLANALGFVTGFTVVFVSLGAFAGAVGGWLAAYQGLVNLGAGLVVVLLGLNFMGVIRIAFLYRAQGSGANVRDLTFASSVVFGLVFAIGWTPCVGAFLGVALMRAAIQGGALEGMFMLFVYSAGLGVPLVASALLIDRLKGAFDFIKRGYAVVNKLAGIFLVLMGVLMATGLMARFMSLFIVNPW